MSADVVQSSAPRLRRAIDVSKWQYVRGPIDWSAVAASGIELVYHRLSVGDALDQHGGTGLEASRRAGLRAGGYHALTGEDIELQVDVFLAAFEPDVVDLPPRLAPMLDLERGDSGAGIEAARRSLAWLEGVEAALGVTPVLYVGPAFARMHRLGDVPALERFPVCIAHYGVAQPAAVAPWGDRWTGHQYSGSGLCNGVLGHVDLSIWRAFPGDPPEGA